MIIFLPCAGMAFIPSTPHLLYMMVKAVGQPQGLVVNQVRLIPEHIISSDSQKNNHYSFKEKLNFAPPLDLRSDIISGPNTGYYIESGKNFVKVINQVIVANTKSMEDHYTDILLCRSPEHLLALLDSVGVDTSKVGYRRFQEKICYVIGCSDQGEDQAINSSTLWIDHETFLPIIYSIYLEDHMVDFVYENWQKISRTWYPMQIKIYMDNKVVTSIKVADMKLTGKLSKKIFNLQKTLDKYPKKIRNNTPGYKMSQPDRTDKIMELDNDLKDFKKMYE